jgi:hypothetical protein
MTVQSSQSFRSESRIRRLKPLVFIGVFGFGMFAFAVGGGPASAHATFVSPATATVGTDVSFTLDVPHERAEDVFNTVVRIKVPDGWTGISCDPFPTWTCTAGPGEIGFIKDSGAAPAQDETFRFAARANDAGRVAFPVVQIYSTGENVLWQDTAIVAAESGANSVTEMPDVPTTLGVDESSSGTPTSSVVSDGDPDDVGSEGAPATSPSSATVQLGVPTEAGATRALDAPVGGSDDGSPASGQRSSTGWLIAAIATVGVAAAGGTTLFVLRRRTRS